MKASLKPLSPLAATLVAALMFAASALGGVGSASAATPVQSSVSAFIDCPGAILFAGPSETGSCISGDFTGVYTGIGQTLGSTQDSVLYMASATGKVTVNYTLTDVTSGKLLLKWLASGSLSGGTCTSPSLVVPESPLTGSTSFVLSTGDVINSGDTLRVHLIWTSLAGTGTPTFCSGGKDATLVSVGTTVVTGSIQPVLTTELRAGTASQTTLAGYSGVAVTYVNTGSADFTAQVLGVLKDSSGRTVDVLAASIDALPNVNVTAFLVFKQYSPGSYTLTVFATTNQHLPVSTMEIAKVTV